MGRFNALSPQRFGPFLTRRKVSLHTKRGGMGFDMKHQNVVFEKSPSTGPPPPRTSWAGWVGGSLPTGGGQGGSDAPRVKKYFNWWDSMTFYVSPISAQKHRKIWYFFLVIVDIRFLGGRTPPVVGSGPTHPYPWSIEGGGWTRSAPVLWLPPCAAEPCGGVGEGVLPAPSSAPWARRGGAWGCRSGWAG